MLRKKDMKKQRQVVSGLWGRRARIIVGSFGVLAALLTFFLQRHGVDRKYSEIGFGTFLLLLLLLSAFRPVWNRLRFWAVLGVILATHLAGWTFLATRTEHFSFLPMFIILVIEVALGASVIAKAIPEDERTVLDYVDRL